MTAAKMAEALVSEPGVYDMPNDVYHADPTSGSLSASGARKLLAPYCPATYRWERDHPVYKDIFDFGSAAHQLVLGDAAQVVTIIDAADYKTKAAQAARDEARAEGRVPVLIGRWVEVEAMAEAIRQHPVASQLFRPGSGKPEQSLFWRDDPSRIWRRARLDWLPNRATDGRLIIPDYKTCRSADPETFARSAADYGYHMSASWYLDAVRALGLDEDPAFVFVAQEKTAPYLVTVIELNETALIIGRNLNRGAINIFGDCLRTNRWPGYSSGVELVALPAYYERRFDEDSSS